MGASLLFFPCPWCQAGKGWIFFCSFLITLWTISIPNSPAQAARQPEDSGSDMK